MVTMSRVKALTQGGSRWRSEPSVLTVDRPAPHLAVVTLDRPDRLNALALALLHQIGDTMRDLDRDPACRAIVLTGTGRAFSAGLELDELDGLGGDAGATVGGGIALQEAAVAAVHRARVATPVVAAINGLALGAGLALACLADVRVAGRSATFELGVQKLGLTGCDLGLSWLLPRLCGASVAFDMMLTGRRLDAEEAHAVGLVSRLVDDDAVLAAAVEAAGQIADLAPIGVRMTKQVMWANLASPTLAQAMELENRSQELALQTRDFVEGLAALRARRAATYTGQ